MKTNMTKKEKSIFIFAFLFVSLVSAFLINNDDQLIIAGWSRSWLDCIVHGRITEFAHICTEGGHTINYGAIVPIIVSILYIPIYIVDLIAGGMSILAYTFYFKILLIFINLYNANLLIKIMKKLDNDERKVYIVVFSIMVGPIIQLFSIGLGQIDAIIVCFILIGIDGFLENKIWMTNIAFAIAICMKPFAAFIAIPCWIYMLKKRWKIIFSEIITVIAVFGVQKLVENRILDYAAGKESWSFIPRLFAASVNNISMPIFLLLIVGFVYVYKVMYVKCDRNIVFGYAAVFYAIFNALVIMHTQWYIYTIIIFAFLGVRYKNGLIYHLLMIGIQIASIGYSYIILPGLNYHYIRYGIVGLNNNYTGRYIGDYLTSISEWHGQISQTILIACVVLIPAVYWLEKRKSVYEITQIYLNERVNKLIVPIMLCMTVLVELIFIVAYFI